MTNEQILKTIVNLKYWTTLWVQLRENHADQVRIDQARSNLDSLWDQLESAFTDLEQERDEARKWARRFLAETEESRREWAKVYGGAYIAKTKLYEILELDNS